VKYVIEILSRNGTTMPKVLHSFAHTSSSIHLVRESVHSVMLSPQWPSEANAFRILSDKGMELYGWPAAASEKDQPREPSDDPPKN
jgi:hypothetical protein